MDVRDMSALAVIEEAANAGVLVSLNGGALAIERPVDHRLTFSPGSESTRAKSSRCCKSQSSFPREVMEQDGAPDTCRDAWARLQSQRPTGYSDDDWRQAIVDAGRLRYGLEALEAKRSRPMTEAENSAPKQRGFQKGKSGNPAGKPKGTRNKMTLLAEALLDDEAEALARVAIDRALEGDPQALRLCLDRIVPPRKDRPISFAMPKIGSAKDAAGAMAAILAAVV
jgi:Family of unknown function (DUF5681)